MNEVTILFQKVLENIISSNKYNSNATYVIFLYLFQKSFMVKLALQIKAQGEAVKSITAPGEDFRWHVKLKNGGSETDVVYSEMHT